MIKKNNEGLTLTELMIVTAILAVISLAVYSTFTGGFRILERINHSVPEEDVDLFFEEFTHDVRNGLNYRGITFTGKEDGFCVPTLIMDTGTGSVVIGTARYVYDGDKKELRRYRVSVSGIYQEKDDPPHTAIKRAESVKFQYYVYDKERRERFWRDEFMDEGLPSAVRVTLELEINGKIKSFVGTADIPAGN